MELDSERLVDLLSTSGQGIEEGLRAELLTLATSLRTAAKELNERVMASASYAEVW